MEDIIRISDDSTFTIYVRFDNLGVLMDWCFRTFGLQCFEILSCSKILDPQFNDQILCDVNLCGQDLDAKKYCSDLDAEKMLFRS